MTAQEIVRELLVRATAPIPNQDVAGYVFAASLIATDYVFLLIDRLKG